MFLLILESIGTSELILIAVVALIVFGPRKLPQMAKMLGKTMAEFKNATNEFKSTWEREVAFEDEEVKKEKQVNFLTDTVAVNSASSQFAPISANENLVQPEVRQLSEEEARKILDAKNHTAESPQPEAETRSAQSKKDWL